MILTLLIEEKITNVEYLEVNSQHVNVIHTRQ